LGWRDRGSGALARLDLRLAIAWPASPRVMRLRGAQRRRALVLRERHSAPAAGPGASCALVRAPPDPLRAIPEYIWAFLLLAMLGPSAWPAVLALAIHNSGILGKLGADGRNLDTRTLCALREPGRRRADRVAAILPPCLALPGCFFYFSDLRARGHGAGDVGSPRWATGSGFAHASSTTRCCSSSPGAAIVLAPT
jgi:hypothetical protein